MNTEQTKQTWHPAGVLVLGLLMLTLLLYQQTALYLVSIWNQLAIGEYAHGYLVLAISIYLIYNLKNKLSAVTPCPEYRALLLVLCASMLWMVSALVDVEMLQALFLLILVFALVWSVLGNQVIQLLALPILFIAFAIPIWFPLSPVLQNITADAVFGTIRLLSIPAFRQDNMIILPAGTLSIEEACSGLRYLLAALTLGTLYAYMNYSQLRTRLIVVIVAASSAILANILRVFVVVYLGYTTEMQHSLVSDHLTLGWYLFAGLITILLFLDTWLHNKRPPAQSKKPLIPDETETSTHKQDNFRYFMFAAMTGMLIAIAPAVVYLSSSPSSNIAEISTPQLPHKAGNWIQTLTNNSSWTPSYHGAINQKQTYKKGKNKIELYMGYYPAQKQGKELINDLNSISNKGRWHTVYPKPLLQYIDGQQVLEQALDNGEKDQQLVWYWYNVAGSVTTNKYEAKLLQALGLLTGKTWGFIIAIAADKNDDIDSTRQVMEDFFLSVKQPMTDETIQISGYH